MLTKIIFYKYIFNIPTFLKDLVNQIESYIESSIPNLSYLGIEYEKSNKNCYLTIQIPIDLKNSISVEKITGLCSKFMNIKSVETTIAESGILETLEIQKDFNENLTDKSYLEKRNLFETEISVYKELKPVFNFEKIEYSDDSDFEYNEDTDTDEMNETIYEGYEICCECFEIEIQFKHKN